MRQIVVQAGLSALDEVAGTKEGLYLIGSMRDSFGVGFSTRGEAAELVELNSVIGRAEGHSHAEHTLDAADKRAEKAEAPVPVFIDPAEINTHLRLIRATLGSMEERYSSDAEIIPALASARADLEAQFHTRPGDTIDFDEDSRLVAMSQLIIERANRSLLEFDRILRTRGNPADPMEVHCLAFAGRVRSSWIAALAAAAAPEGPRRLAIAEAESASLRPALDQLFLGTAVSEVGYAGLGVSAYALSDWAIWTRDLIDQTQADQDGIADARSAGMEESEIQDRVKRVQANQEIIRLSIEGIQLWQAAIRAPEEIFAGTNIISGLGPSLSGVYAAARRIRERCERMKASAESGDLNALRVEADRNRNDDAVKDYLKSINAIVGVSNAAVDVATSLLLTVGILKVSSMAASAAGSLVSAGEGASVANIAAQVGLESLTFTAVNRGLNAAVGNSPKLSFLVDLALNAGLFGVLRFTGSLIHANVTERGFELTGWAATHAVNFGLMQVFGAIQARLEAGFWPNSTQLKGMAGETLILTAIMSRPSRPVAGSEGSGASHSRLKILETLHSKYADRITGIEEARNRLAQRIYEDLQAARTVTDDEAASLKKDQQEVEDTLNKLVGDVIQDGDIDRKALANELADASLHTPEAQSQALTESLNLAREAQVQRAGGEAQFTFANGETDVVESGLTDTGVPYSVETGGEGLDTIVAEPEGKAPLIFVEREAEPEPEPEAAPPRKGKRTYVASPPPKPARPAKPRKAKTPPKGELFDPDGGLTSQGVTQVRKMKRFKNATPDQANEAVKSDAGALENIVREHFRRAINRKEFQGKLISGGNIRTYAQKLGGDVLLRPLDLEEATVDFLQEKRNANLRRLLVEKLTVLRDDLGMTPDVLSDAEIDANPWEASFRLAQKAANTLPKGSSLRRAAEEFPEMFRRSLGDLKPDGVIWDPGSGRLKVIDPTHTVNTEFETFHEFKTLLYVRIFEELTGVPAEGIDFRSPREQTTVQTPNETPDDDSSE